MESNGQPAIDYQAVLADLKKKRDDLDKAITGIETMLGVVITPGTGSLSFTGQTPAAEIAPDSFFGMNISTAVQKYLGMQKRPKTTSEIAEALEAGGLPHQSDNFGNTVGSVLTRNAEGATPIFVKVKRGTWALRSWYPNWRPKAKDDETASGDPEGNEPT